MRAMAVTSYEEPLEPIDAPEPVLPDRHALIEILTCGVCFSDVKTSRGHMPFSEDLVSPMSRDTRSSVECLTTEPPGLVEEGCGRSSTTIGRAGAAGACRRGDETLCARLVGWAGSRIKAVSRNGCGSDRSPRRDPRCDRPGPRRPVVVRARNRVSIGHDPRRCRPGSPAWSSGSAASGSTPRRWHAPRVPPSSDSTCVNRRWRPLARWISMSGDRTMPRRSRISP